MLKSKFQMLADHYRRQRPALGRDVELELERLYDDCLSDSEKLQVTVPNFLKASQEEHINKSFPDFKELYKRDSDSLEAYGNYFNAVNLLSAVVNVSDTFAYSCADAETVDGDDLDDLRPWIYLYGYHAIVAYVALKRDYDPIVQYATHPLYKKLTSTFRLMCESDEGEHEFLFYDIRELVRSDNLDLNVGLTSVDERIRKRFRLKYERINK